MTPLERCRAEIVHGRQRFRINNGQLEILNGWWQPPAWMTIDEQAKIRERIEYGKKEKADA